MIRKGFALNKCRLCGLSKSQGLNVYSALAKGEGLLSKISKHLSKEVNIIVFVCVFYKCKKNIISSENRISQILRFGLHVLSVKVRTCTAELLSVDQKLKYLDEKEMI
jgi:hypothetical protein